MSDGLAQAVLDALPDATAVLNPAGTILDVNRAWLMFAVDNGGQPDMTGGGLPAERPNCWPVLYSSIIISPTTISFRPAKKGPMSSRMNATDASCSLRAPG